MGNSSRKQPKVTNSTGDPFLGDWKGLGRRPHGYPQIPAAGEQTHPGSQGFSFGMVVTRTCPQSLSCAQGSRSHLQL
jgi:hypothetical protein